MEKSTKTGETDIPYSELFLSEHGITLKNVTYFHYRDFRYTSLADALERFPADGNRGGLPESCGT